MKRHVLGIMLAVSAGFAFAAGVGAEILGESSMNENKPMELGAFSTSLAVKDLATSRSFYEKLGFRQTGGNPDHNWLIMASGDTVIGLFQGMFEDNIMTFNPGWSGAHQELDTFTDVRKIQAKLREAGVKLLVEADPEGSGPAHIVLQDPDGNQIMLDQHVAKPGG